MVVETTVSLFSFALRMHVAGGGEQYAIAIDDSAIGITEQSAVGIAVESHSEIELPVRSRQLLCPAFRDAAPRIRSLMFLPSGETWMNVA